MCARLRCGGDLPLPRPGADRPPRGNCHPLSCAPDNQVRCVFGSAPYQKPPSTVRNVRAVRKTGSCGTRRIFRGTRCAEQASVVRKGYSVPETPFYGTGCIFKGPQNSRLHRLWTAPCRTGRIFRGVPCQKQPPAAPDASSVRETAPALFVRSGGPFPCSFDGTRDQKRPRSDVSRHKKTSKSIKTF